MMYFIEVRNNEEGFFEKKMIEGEVILGREGDIVLAGDDVSRRHARIFRENGNILIEDLGSTNGTYLDGERIEKKTVVMQENVIRIGRFIIKLIKQQELHFEELMAKIKDEIAKNLERKKEVIKTDDDFKREVRSNLIEIFSKQGIKDDELFKRIYNDVAGYGVIEDYLSDPGVTEIMVNGFDPIYVEKGGRLYRTESSFKEMDEIMRVIERIVSPIGRRVDESSPYVDARLKDGSRVNIIIPPLSLKGPVITIRKFSKSFLSPDDLVRIGSLSKGMLEFLKFAVCHRKNIIVSGGTGSGKTTLLNCLSSFISDDERIITIEDSAELKLSKPHIVSLETKPPNIEGKGQVTIRDLVRNALRMRPDRIIVGECRGAEALDMLQAMNTGHDGSLTTLHANSTRDALSRLSETGWHQQLRLLFRFLVSGMAKGGFLQ